MVKHIFLYLYISVFIVFFLSFLTSYISTTYNIFFCNSFNNKTLDKYLFLTKIRCESIYRFSSPITLQKKYGYKRAKTFLPRLWRKKSWRGKNFFTYDRNAESIYGFAPNFDFFCQVSHFLSFFI